jgi:protein-tyrosine phosphatase
MRDIRTMSQRLYRAFFATLIGIQSIALPAVWAAEASSRPEQVIPFTDAAVDSPDNRSFTVTWKADSAVSVAVYAGTDPAHIGRDRLVGQAGRQGELVVADLPAMPRWYFELVPDHGQSLVIADRSLHLPTAPNFRDAGGYRTQDGRWVRMGLLYRSDQLNLLSDADLQVLHAIGLHLVCDLRTDGERDHGMDRLPAGATTLIADVSGDSGESARMMGIIGDKARQQTELGDGRGAGIMINASRQFVDSDSAHKAYGAVFARLADPTMLPGAFHCTAGKDRAGWGAAIFLSIMGVPRDTIMRDYLLSNIYLKAKNQHLLEAMKGQIDPVLMEPLTGVRPEYLDASFDEVAKRYGSFARYLHEGLGLDDARIETLRQEFLTGAPSTK